METTSAATLQIGFGSGVLYSVLGMLVVFFALVCLMVIIMLLVKVTDKAAAKKAPAAEAAAAPEPEKVNGPAPGSAGQLKLYTTDPKDAAMVMAIVADSLGKPLNELRFISIREVKG